MKRYTRIKDRDVKLADNGELVTYADYLALQAAPREALDGWEEWLGAKEDADRVEFLRAQFLDDK